MNAGAAKRRSGDARDARVNGLTTFARVTLVREIKLQPENQILRILSRRRPRELDSLDLYDPRVKCPVLHEFRS